MSCCVSLVVDCWVGGISFELLRLILIISDEYSSVDIFVGHRHTLIILLHL